MSYMGFLDLRTIIFIYVLTNIVSTMVIVLLWRQTHKRFRGTTLWVTNYIFQTSALLLIELRNTIPDWISIDLANTLAVTGMLLGYIGLERFLGKKSSQVHNYLIVAAFTLIHIWFTFIQPDLTARNLNASAVGLMIFLQCAWLMLYRAPLNMKKLSLNVGIVFCAFSLVNTIRIFEYLIHQHSATDYFKSALFEAFVMISYQMLYILLTFSLILMFNKRLLMGITSEEEKFSKAFNTSHSAISITRLPDGLIIDANDGFQNITGHSLKEIKGNTSINLHLWDRIEDRAFVIDELSNNNKISGREFKFRKHNGDILIGLLSAEIININNEECILSTINDITERQQAEEALKRSEERYRSLFTEMLEAFALHEIISDKNGKPIDYRFLEVNPSFEKLTGLKAHEIIERTVLEVLPNTEVSWIEKYGKVALTGEPIIFEDYSMVLKRHYRVVAFSPKLGQFATLFDDITERKKLEVEQFRLLDIIENSLNEIYVFDSSTLKFEYVNQGALTNIGYSLEEMKTITPIEIKPQFTLEQFNKIILPLKNQEKEVLVFETIHRRKNGTEYQVEIHLQLHRTEGKSVFFAIIIDITDRKRTEKEINDLNTQLEQRIFERTQELEQKNIELARMNRLFVGRELRMAELKQKIKHLESKIKEKP